MEEGALKSGARNRAEAAAMAKVAVVEEGEAPSAAEDEREAPSAVVEEGRKQLSK